MRRLAKGREKPLISVLQTHWNQVGICLKGKCSPAAVNQRRVPPASGHTFDIGSEVRIAKVGGSHRKD
jgi:hypothetical protein